jgi:DNA-binding NtrC family response regulator
MNVIKHALVLSENEIGTEHLIFQNENASVTKINDKNIIFPEIENANEIDLKKILKEHVFSMEKIIIRKSLAKFQGNKSKIAKFLNIDYKTMLDKIKRHGL